MKRHIMPRFIYSSAPVVRCFCSSNKSLATPTPLVPEKTTPHVGSGLFGRPPTKGTGAAPPPATRSHVIVALLKNE